MSSSQNLSWSTIAIRKRDAVAALVPPEWRISGMPSRQEKRDVTGEYINQFLSDREIEITETDVAGIAKKVHGGEWTAVETTKAFCHRAALAHQLTNCLLEIFFDDAIARAKSLDEYYETHKKPVGPLHGVPISLKDQFHVKGVETSMGYVGWIGTFEGEKGTGKDKNFESELTKILFNLGAVFYVKTSVPHTLMSPESVNNIMGYVWNPKNRLLSAGGSSGGEGALIGLRGSPLGFGTDIGGSIRIPAAFNGLFGLRPSNGRIPYQGMANSMDGQNTILSVVGPISPSAESLILVTKSILSQEPWLADPLVLELPWRNEKEQEILDIVGSTDKSDKKLSFAVMMNDGTISAQPPVLRAVETVKSLVERLGHEIIEWKPPSHMNLTKIAGETWGMDGGKDFFDAFGLSGEPPAPQMGLIVGDGPAEQMKGNDIFKLNKKKREAQKEYLDYWISSKEKTGTGRPVDAIICPLAPFAAAIPETYKDLHWSLWVNVLDYTAAIIPVTTVDKNVDKKNESFKGLSDADERINGYYDPEIYDGAHVSVQLVGRRLEEEKILTIARYIGDALRTGK